MALISLAIQLGQGAHCLVKFLETISDAPSEVKRLRHLISQIYAIATGARNVLEGQKALHGDSIPMIETIHSTLMTCQRQLNFIQEVLDKVGGVESGRNLVLRNWARFQLTLQKDDIAEFERQLGQAVQMLNVLLTMNMMASNTKTTMLLIDKFRGLLRTSLTSESEPQTSGPGQDIIFPDRQVHRRINDVQDMPGDEENSAAMRYGRQRKQIKTSSITKATNWEAFTRLGLVKVMTFKKKKRTEYEDERSDFEIETIISHYNFRPSFLSWSLEFVVARSGNASPKMSLHIQRVLRRETIRKVYECMRWDDVRAFQEMLARGEISLDSVKPLGETLMMMASEVSRVGWARHIPFFLLEQGYVPHPEDAKGWTCQLQMNTPDPHVVFEICRVIYSKQDISECSTEQLISVLAGCDTFPPHLLETFKLLSAGLDKTLLSDAEYLGSILHLLTRCLDWEITRSLKQERNELIRKLVAGGADLHYRDEYSLKTLLQNIVSFSPLDNEMRFALEWFEMLESCKVDLDKYLLEEAGLCHIPFEMWSWRESRWTGSYACINPRKIDIRLCPRGRPRMAVSGRWLTPESSASLVLQEFNFCPDIIIRRPLGQDSCLDRATENCETDEVSEITEYCTYRDPNVSEAYDTDEDGRGEEAWDLNDELIGYCHFDDLWPFHTNTHTICGTGNLLGEGCLAFKWCTVHPCRFNHARFARKQAKKSAKHLKSQGVRATEPFALPGGWIA